MSINCLNDRQIKSLIREHDQKCSNSNDIEKKMVISTASDGGGLRLELRDSGAPRWIFRYTRPNGKKNELKLGVYPDIPLAMAREIASAHRCDVQMGVDPQDKKEKAIEAARLEEQREARTFGVLLGEFLATQNWAESTTEKNESRIRNHIGKLLDKSLESITPRLILDEVLRPIAAADTQKRVRLLISQVFKFAISSGDTLCNPARDVGGALKTPVKRHFAAARSIAELQIIWKGIESIMSVPSRLALQLQFLTFQRPYNVRSIEWTEIDIEKSLWTIPATKMKLTQARKDSGSERPHLVPLSTQALSVITHIPETKSRFCFPSIRSKDRPITDSTLLVALRGVGITQEQTTCHGSRTAASSILNESGLWSADAIERQLAHALPGGDVRNAYNRADFMVERVKMMQWWGDLLEALS